VKIFRGLADIISKEKNDAHYAFAGRYGRIWCGV
jgi:hypothetical protein